MALKKDFHDSSKYYYAVIHRVSYAKNAANSESGIEHMVQIYLKIKDHNNSDYEVIENDLCYSIPDKKFKKKPVISNTPKIDEETGETILDENDEPITEEAINGYEEVEDESDDLNRTM